MAKKKNKNNKNAFNQFSSSWIKGMRKNRGWLSAIGGIIGGAALVSAITSQRGQRVMDELATSVKSFAGQSKQESNAKPDSSSKPKQAGNT